MEDTPKTQDSTEYSWQERALKAEAELAKALQKLEYLEAQLRLLTAKRFGRSSEKTSKDQLQLFEDVFNEAESNAEPFAPEPELITVPAHQRAKRKKKKGVSLEGLPETVVEYRLPEEELTCSCGHERHIIGQEVTKELVVVPTQFPLLSMCSMFTPAATARITEMARLPLWSKHRNQTGLSRAVLLLLLQ